VLVTVEKETGGLKEPWKEKSLMIKRQIKKRRECEASGPDRIKERKKIGKEMERKSCS
jgi:hypothetical protein